MFGCVALLCNRLFRGLTYATYITYINPKRFIHRGLSDLSCLSSKSNRNTWKNSVILGTRIIPVFLLISTFVSNQIHTYNHIVFEHSCAYYDKARLISFEKALAAKFYYTLHVFYYAMLKKVSKELIIWKWLRWFF